MDSKNDRLDDRPTSQNIPLQDLSGTAHRTTASADITDGTPEVGRSLTTRARDRLSRASLRRGSGYERLDDRGGSGSGGGNGSDARNADLLRPQAGPYHSPSVEDDSDMSPIDLGGFQDAVGSFGITLDTTHVDQSAARSVRANSHSSQLSVITEGRSSGRKAKQSRRLHSAEGDGFFSPVDSDTTPLTNAHHLQPSDGGKSPIERSSFHSIRFDDDAPAASPGHLGDDLAQAEAGFAKGGHSLHSMSTRRSRSLSPGPPSPLSRAGTVMRAVSQRVVNLSNEQDIVTQSMRHKSSLKKARMDAPPPLPQIITDYPSQETIGTPASLEKTPSSISGRDWHAQNPLKGNSLGIFPPDSLLRRKLCDILIHPTTEPTILILIILQTVILTIQCAPNVYDAFGNETRSQLQWGHSWIDYALFTLFVIYSFEIIARIIVSGFIFNAPEYSTIDRSMGLRKAMIEKGKNLISLQRKPTLKRVPTSDFHPTIISSFQGLQADYDLPHDFREQQKMRLARRAFLRHSFNRLDFVAVISYWITYSLCVTGQIQGRRWYVFEMLSCLRIIRLLGISSGTSVILRSLKKAAPLLLNVAFLIGFFWLLFAIIGTQSFKSSFRRTCVWIDPEGQENLTLNDAPDSVQFCGGYLNSTSGRVWPWLDADGSNGTGKGKGYICPPGSLCIQGPKNPYNNTVSYDNIFQSLELVFVIMTGNTFSDLMYYNADSDYLAAVCFYAAGIIILNFWLINLLIAVITSSFQIIREESKVSAFTGGQHDMENEHADSPRRISAIKRAYEKTYWLWVTVIAYDLIVQCLRSASMGSEREVFIDDSETVVTFLLDFEILFRLVGDWRGFFRRKLNYLDLGLAIVTSIIQLPLIHNSGEAYAWLTVFQIARFYRIVCAFPVTRDLLTIVFRNAKAFLNLVLFVFLLTFLVAIFAAQILRGQFPQTDDSGSIIYISFFNIYNSFVGMYQILSSENWTTILYGATQYNMKYNTAWICASFFILWFVLSFFIVLNMFIAVIQESFDVSEDEKRMMQVKAFVQKKELGGSSHGNLSLSSIIRLGRPSKNEDPLDYGPATMEMLLRGAVVKEFLDDSDQEPLLQRPTTMAEIDHKDSIPVQTGYLSGLWTKIKTSVTDREPNPFYSSMQLSRAYDDLDPRTMAQEVLSAAERRKKEQRQYLQRHPNYNVSLYIFKPDNPIRRFCQRIVGPGRGSTRIQGVDPIKPVWYAFSAFIYGAIIVMVIIACITTPLYQRNYFKKRGNVFTPNNWFTWTDFGFACVFTTEAIIKVIADGFFWTPNAYFRGSWGFIDGVVLVTLWINVMTALYNDGAVSRAVGAFKALRALRLLNVSDSARDTFHSVIVLGGWKVLSAAFVSLSLLFPFAIYGVNLFNARLMSCNDGNYPGGAHLANCVGEFNNSIYQWDVLAPRQAANPFYSFDNFAEALFILFQIVSQEGWVDVMTSAVGAVGKFKQPIDLASQGNAMFFIVFNLLGAVFVLTLFISVFMRNYTEQTGVAYLTADQRSWLELRKLLKQIKPSKRPIAKEREEWRTWCYRIAVKKHGQWQRFITTCLLIILVLEMCEWYGEPVAWTRTREGLMLILISINLGNVILRIVGLTWKRFRGSTWDLFSLMAVTGAFITIIIALTKQTTDRLYDQLHKLFLVSVTLLLIPRNNQLDQLFKTAAASLTSIGNLFATWFVLFLVYAIALTQTFGLTRFGENESWHINFRDVPNALILLFRMSCGEGWNQLMEDFAGIYPPYCVTSENFFDSDCGSTAWARVLFISWNILSMYIFVSLFVSLIYESFSYVYQRSSGLSAVSREEIRRFKQAWAMYDPKGTGWITKEQFPRLLSELSGVFQVRIYDQEWSIHSILDDSLDGGKGGFRVIDGVDIDKLNKRLQNLPIRETQERRKTMNIFYEEMLVSADRDRGISFTSLLMILAHYNVISDQKSLRLEEFLRRRTRITRVQETVERKTVMGFFDMLHWSRQFRRKIREKKEARLSKVPRFEVPEILVDDQDEHTTNDQGSVRSASPNSTDIAESFRGRSPSTASSTGVDPRAVAPIITDFRNRSESRGPSPTMSRSHSPGLSPIARSPSGGHGERSFDGSLSPMNGGTPQNRSRSGSPAGSQGVLDILDNSAWGESIRRSFTTRKPGQNGRGSQHHHHTGHI